MAGEWSEIRLEKMSEYTDEWKKVNEQIIGILATC